jgi:FtsP/CotA-like multicopper oxidase with cupredoxin domain
MHAFVDRRTVLRAGAGSGLLAAAGALAGGGTAEPARPGLVEPGDPVIAAAEAARYHSGATRTITLDPVPAQIDLGGVVVSTWTYGGVLPGAEIRANRGDVIAARLVNHLPEPTTVHWHGIAIRNDMDGVPQVTQKPVAPGASFTYRFTAANPGTYWLHSHVGVQRDRGLYAPLIIEDPDEAADYDHDWTVVLDDWIDGTGHTPDQVLADLRAGMGNMGPATSTASGTSTPTTGMSTPGLGMTGATRGEILEQGATSSLLGGDAGDVRYPYYLINGRLPADPAVFTARPGQRARIRVINAAADTAFRLALGGHTLTVTHTDGFPVQPVQAHALLLGMGERYDIEVTLEDGAFPLVALAEGKNATALAIVRTGHGPAPAARPAELETTPIGYIALRATEAAALTPRTPDVTAALHLTGSMLHYNWSIDNQPYDPSNPPAVRVETGQRVRVTVANTTAMWHPVHVHGHTFQLAGGGPRKDTVIVLPGRSITAHLDADNPGQWLAHCHNAYHAAAGMMAVIGYRTARR